MPDILYDSEFNIEQTHCYTLSIQLRLDGFSFFICNPETNRLLAVSQTEHKISNEVFLTRRFLEWFEETELLKKTFQKVRVILFNQYFSVYPDAFNTPQVRNGVRDHLFSNEQLTDTAENYLPNFNARITFPLAPDLNKVLNDCLGEYQIIHPLRLLSESIQKSDRGSNYRVIMSPGPSFFYLLVVAGNELLLANTYQAKHHNDVVFYLYNSIRQLDLEPNSMILEYVGGNLSEDLGKNIQNFFHSVQPVQSTPLPSVSDELLHKEPELKNFLIYR